MTLTLNDRQCQFVGFSDVYMALINNKNGFDVEVGEAPPRDRCISTVDFSEDTSRFAIM
jgi:hypothetical protein